MRPIDHFFSALSRERDEQRLEGEFSSLIGAVLGVPAAGELCARTLDRIKKGSPPDIQRLGSVAAFFRGEYEDTMPLEPEDWEDIRETLEDAAPTMNLDTLTRLMGELLDRGKLR
jgi:hypothetical protein